MIPSRLGFHWKSATLADEIERTICLSPIAQGKSTLRQRLMQNRATNGATIICNTPFVTCVVSKVVEIIFSRSKYYLQHPHHIVCNTPDHILSTILWASVIVKDRQDSYILPFLQA